MAEYMVLIWENPALWADLGEAEEREVLAAHGAFAQRNGAALRGGNRLHAGSAAKTLRPDGAGGVTVTDGAFAETKEVIGGYYLFEAADDDEALAIARQVPAPTGGVELRAVWPMD